MKEMYAYALDTYNKLIDDIFLHNDGDHPELIKSDLDNRVNATEALLYNTLVEMIKIDIDTDEEVAMIDKIFDCFEYLYNITEYPECDDLKEVYGHLIYDSDRRWSMYEKLATVGLGPIAF